MVQKVQVTPTGHESGARRFPRSEDIERPQISKWRGNLTALSQFRNLYFVAFRDQVFVYEPQYPNQKIPSVPAGIIKLQQNRPQAFGYIDPTLPLGINHLIVRELGNDEIILLACDGGDIIGYRIRDIHKAVEQASGRDDLQVVPFFNENVGDSGWGLDVHKSQRLIAVSSNSHNIHMFAFALSKKDVILRDAKLNAKNCFELHHDGFDERRERSALSGRFTARTRAEDRDNRREVDYCWTLKGHMSNIPSIAFYDDDSEDPENVLLASTDIEGVTRIWSVWDLNSTCFQCFEHKGLSSSAPPAFGRAETKPEGMGWAVGCIPRVTARIATSDMEAYGCSPTYGRREFHGPCVDISDSVRQVADSSTKCLVSLDPEHTSVAPPVTVDISELMEDSESFFEEEEVADAEELMEFIQHEVQDPTYIWNGVEPVLTDIGATEPTANEAIYPRENVTEDVGVEHSPTSATRSLPCNVFVTLGENILLAGGGSRRHAVVCCQNPLSQEYSRPWPSPNIAIMKRFERMNMMHQIPELGLIVIGTQTGRVAILSTTYYAKKDRYGFKIEAIVPYQSQEKQNVRPYELLLGMAVSYVQGCQSEAYSPSSNGDEAPQAQKISQRRYRLLLYYYDHTVLSYEIFCAEEDGLLII